MSEQKRTAVAGLLLAAFMLVPACSDDAEPAGPAKTTEAADDAPEKSKAEEAEAVVAVIKRFQRLVDAADGDKACALMTKSLQGVYAENPGASDCASGVEQLHDELDGFKLASMKLKPEDVIVNQKDAVADHRKIAKRNGWNADDTDSYNMVRSGATWKIDYIG